MVFNSLAGKEAQYGGGVSNFGTRSRSRGSSVEHSCGDLQFRTGHGKDQEEPHPQSGRLQ